MLIKWFYNDHYPVWGEASSQQHMKSKRLELNTHEFHPHSAETQHNVHSSLLLLLSVLWSAVQGKELERWKLSEGEGSVEQRQLLSPCGEFLTGVTLLGFHTWSSVKWNLEVFNEDSNILPDP